MTFSRAPAGVRALTACLSMLVLVAHCAISRAQEVQPVPAPRVASDPERSAGRPLTFHLAAQPLDDALKAFGQISDLAVLAPAPLLEGKTSAAVQGTLSARDALLRLLIGTGLHAEFTGPDEAIIVADSEPTSTAQAPADEVNADAPVGGIDGNGEREAFAAGLQARVTEALCGNRAAVPGSYWLRAQLRIDDKGKVVTVDVVESSGLASRDRAVASALRGLVLDEPPPHGLPQPVTIALRPAGNGVHIRCP